MLLLRALRESAQEAKMKVANQEYGVTSPVSERIKTLKEQIENERDETHKKLLERRIASLASGVGIIRVGASTSAESLPLKLKIEDAQYACKSALEEGYVKGGGLFYNFLCWFFLWHNFNYNIYFIFFRPFNLYPPLVR